MIYIWVFWKKYLKQKRVKLNHYYIFLVGDKELNVLRFLFPPAILERALDIVDKKMVQKIIFKPSNKELYQVLVYK